MAKAQYLNAKQLRDEGLVHVKKAILAYQDADDSGGVARANGEFGLILLSQGVISGARDYFSISTRAAAQLGNVLTTLQSGVLELATDVILGNLTRAREKAGRLKDDAVRIASREYELYLDFIAARIEFELGRYDVAEKRLASGLCDATTIGNGMAQALFQRWLGRTVAYRGAPARGLEILARVSDTPEGRLFRAETLVLLGQFGDAAATTEVDVPKDSAFRPGCTISWDSGFANVEDLSTGPDAGVVTHLTAAFGGYAHARHGEGTQGIEKLKALTRAGDTVPANPYAALYLFLYSQILPEVGGQDLEDMVTILGKAVKHLQERTSRIDDYGDKTSFLRRNHWNARLIEKAKRYNLV